MAIDFQRKTALTEENTQNPQTPEVSVFKVFFYGIIFFEECEKIGN